ncbi:MAG TPA: hypothetical protein VIJ31_06490 [Acidothermaceae bacterium]|jgi:hypothetical protein|nr:hypothetical protein [Acidothermaceae bacterium]
MGLLDKAKASATAAMAQGQAKVGAFQQGRSESELYKALGEAFYREQRQGGDHEATVAALVAVDTALAQAAQAAAAQPAPYQQPAAPYQQPAAPGQPYTPPPASGTAPTAGNFTLDDM